MILWSDDLLIKLSQTALFSHVPKEKIEEVLQVFSFFFWSQSDLNASTSEEKNSIDFQMLQDKMQRFSEKKYREDQTFLLFLLETDATLLKKMGKQSLECLQVKEKIFTFKKDEKLFLHKKQGKILFLDLEHFYSVCLSPEKKHSTSLFIYFLIKELLEQMRVAQEESMIKKKEKTKERLWFYLQQQAVDGKGEFKIKRADLAQTLFVSRQHLEKLLKELKDENRLKYDRKHYILLKDELK